MFIVINKNDIMRHLFAKCYYSRVAAPGGFAHNYVNNDPATFLDTELFDRMNPFNQPSKLAIPEGNAAGVGRYGGFGPRLAGVWDRAEGLTWVLIFAVYGGWLAILMSAAWLPLWLVCPLAALVGGWHAHLQHELLHGHPTEKQWVNDLLALPSLALLYPYSVFRRSHLEHHLANLTDPADDPESFYVTSSAWAHFGPLRRLVLIVNNSLLGRFFIGPWLAAGSLFKRESKRLLASDPLAWGEWLLHGAVVAGLLWIVETLSGMPAWVYVLFVAYPANGIVMIRSFLEHRPRANEEERTAIVEAGWFWSLLFLNNNLHVVHHERPGEAWYRLPGIYRAQREVVLQRNGGYIFRGYADVASRYLLKPKDLPVVPS